MSCPGSWSERLVRAASLTGVVLGTLSVSASVNAETTADRTPPTSPTISVKAASRTTLSFTWTDARDNVGVVAYDIWLGKALPLRTTFARADFQGLACNQRYELHVVARDSAGNTSTPTVRNAATVACEGGGASPPPGGGTPPPGPPPVKPPPPRQPPPPPPPPPGDDPFVDRGYILEPVGRCDALPTDPVIGGDRNTLDGGSLARGGPFPTAGLQPVVRVRTVGSASRRVKRRGRQGPPG
jgi:hypothetical protein